MDTEPVRIDKDLMNRLRKRIIQNDVNGKVYGKLSKTVESAIKEYLEKDHKKSLAKELEACAYGNVEYIYNVLEFLSVHECLNDDGKNLRQDFWNKYIREKT